MQPAWRWQMQVGPWTWHTTQHLDRQCWDRACIQAASVHSSHVRRCTEHCHPCSLSRGQGQAARGSHALVPPRAGIPMRDLVAGCMAAYIEEEGVLDLNHLEEAVGSTSQVFAAVHCNLGLVRARYPPLGCDPHWGCI